MAKPAAAGTTDFNNRGRCIKLDGDPKPGGAPRSGAKSGAKRAFERLFKDTRRTKSGPPPPVKPDKFPPGPHRMGKELWKLERRKLDALFAMYVMGWETKKSEWGGKCRHYIKQLDDGRWESDFLVYFHDDTRACYQGVERLRKEGLYLTVEARKDGYEVVEKTKKVSVRDEDLNFAIMAACLLVKGISYKDIEYAWENQDDWSIKAAKRRRS